MSDQASDVLAMLLTKPVTRINGRPELEEIDNLEKEVARIVASAKTTRFTQGNKYGHLVMIIGESAYQTIIGDAGFVFTEPTDAGAYDTVTIVDNIATNSAAKAQAEAVHKRKQAEYYRWVAVESAARQLIVGAIDEELLVEIYDEWVQYEAHSPSAIITFLRNSVCLAATTDDQLLLQAKLFEPWDQTENILSYFKKLDLAQKAMVKAHVPCEDAAKAIQASAQMTASGIFSERQITEWEEKIHTDKTWGNLKTYYTKLYKSKMQYTKGDARRNGHESANAMRAKEKEMEKNLEQFVDEFHQNSTINKVEINAIKEDQKVFVTLGEKLMQQMKTQQDIIEKLSKRLENKENATPNSTNTQQDTIDKLTKRVAEAEKRTKQRGEREKQKHECPNCKQAVFHQPANCPEINEAKRWPGWTTRL
jgi:hypothetical protein